MNAIQKFTLAFFAIFVVAYWVYIQFLGTTDSFHNYMYSFLFGLIPLVGGAIAMLHAGMWGGMKSAVGKAVFFVGLGVFLWGVGESIWSYYNFFLGEPAPYPSLADLGFAPSIFFYGLGAWYLSRATGAKFGLRNKYAKFFVTVAPLVVLVVSYYLLVVVARGGVLIPEGETPLKIVLDIVYPLGDLVALMVAVLVSGLSFKYWGGKYLPDIIAILAGLGVMFVADLVFSYTTTTGLYYNANFGDLLLATGTFLLTWGVLGFTTIKSKDAPVQKEPDPGARV